MSGLLRLLLLVGFIVKFWWLILLILVVAAAGFWLWDVVTRQDAELERQNREHAAVVARADEQHTCGYSPATTAASAASTHQSTSIDPSIFR
jgi:cytoskeletal protein RodZ